MEAQSFARIENGTLNTSVNLRFPGNDYRTFHISCYAYGIGIDDARLAHLTVVLQDITQVSAYEQLEPETCLKEYCADAKCFGTSTVLLVKTKAAHLRVP